MDIESDSELDTELLNTRSKIWEDKKRLGLISGVFNNEECASTSEVSMHLKHGRTYKKKVENNMHEDIRERDKDLLISHIVSDSPGFGNHLEHRCLRSPLSPTSLPDDLRSCKKDEFIAKLTNSEGIIGLGEKQSPDEEHNPILLPDDVRSCKKDELISQLTKSEGLLCLGENNPEEEAQPQPMVRFGEYSPQNPGLLSPGKTLLGLGEYEEKRRQILERKKREYLEQMTQARQAAKDAVPTRAEQYQYQELPEFRRNTYIATKSSEGTQTDLRITGYVDDSEFSPVVAATQTPGGEIVVSPGVSPYSHVTNISTQTSGGNLRYSNHTPVTVVNNTASTGIITLPQPSYIPLSPRERKLAEFRESYSPSFLEGRPLRPGGFDLNMDHTPEIRRRREVYQEELRKQIEEKKRIEAEQQRKEQLQEAAIARRAELQRERMRQEYIQEEALRRERHLQRLRQSEEFQRKQEALKLEAELEREAEARRKLEKRLEELENGLAQHPHITQSLGVSLPVPALRAKFSSENSIEATKVSPEIVITKSKHKHNRTVSREEQINNDDDNSNNNNSDKSGDNKNVIQTFVTTSLPQQDLNVEQPVQNRTSVHLEPSDNVKHSHISDVAYEPPSSDTVNHSVSGREISEPVTVSYHRPPSEIIRAAGYDEASVPRTRHKSEILTQVVQHIPTQDPNKGKKRLDDSIPIPILRAPSPVIPNVRGQASVGSEAMQKVEGKWQVPAVERNYVHTNPNQNVLTQLGAVRHQLQLEQMRMEQYLQQKLKNES